MVSTALASVACATAAIVCFSTRFSSSADGPWFGSRLLGVRCRAFAAIADRADAEPVLDVAGQIAHGVAPRRRIAARHVGPYFGCWRRLPASRTKSSHLWPSHLCARFVDTATFRCSHRQQASMTVSPASHPAQLSGTEAFAGGPAGVADWSNRLLGSPNLSPVATARMLEVVGLDAVGQARSFDSGRGHWYWQSCRREPTMSTQAVGQVRASALSFCLVLPFRNAGFVVRLVVPDKLDLCIAGLQPETRRRAGRLVGRHRSRRVGRRDLRTANRHRANLEGVGSAVGQSLSRRVLWRLSTSTLRFMSSQLVPKLPLLSFC